MASYRTRRLPRTSFAAAHSSLARHMANAIDGRLATASAAASSLALFTTITHDDVGPFVRNTGFWAVDLVERLTCICPSREGSSLVGLGTAITKRHILYHKHGGAIPDGDTLRFVTSDNTIVLRTQDKSTPLTIPDFTVGLLDSDLPATITPCPIAPDDIQSYLSFTQHIPILLVDQEGKGLVHDVRGMSQWSIYNAAPTNATRLNFYEAIVTNDSGKGWFGIINDQLVLLGLTQATTLGQGVMGFNSTINAGIVTVDALGAVSTGYTVTNPTLTGFLV